MPKISSGSMLRSPRHHRDYRRHIRTKPVKNCDFCLYTQPKASVVKRFDQFLLVENLFPYSHWDSMSVTEHLLLIPKRHIKMFADMSSEEQAEWFDLVSSYEIDGYSIYTRSHHNVTKTIPRSSVLL